MTNIKLSQIRSETLSESKQDKADRLEEEYLNQFLDDIAAENYWNMLEFEEDHKDERDKDGKEV